MSNSTGRGLQANVLGTFDTVVMAVAGQRPGVLDRRHHRGPGRRGGPGQPGGPAVLRDTHARHRAGVQLPRPDRRQRRRQLLLGGRARSTPSSGFISGWALVDLGDHLHGGRFAAGRVDDARPVRRRPRRQHRAVTVVGAAWFLVMAGAWCSAGHGSPRARSGSCPASRWRSWRSSPCSPCSARATPRPLRLVLVRLRRTSTASRGFAAGALIAAFYYWGWDVTSNLNEETSDGRRTTGLGGLIGVRHRLPALRGLHRRGERRPHARRQIEDNGATCWPRSATWSGRAAAASC